MRSRLRAVAADHNQRFDAYRAHLADGRQPPFFGPELRTPRAAENGASALDDPAHVARPERAPRE